MNKKIALSAASILTSLALMSGAAFAFFSDTATSTNNTFGAGSLDLDISNTNSGFADDTSATFTVSNMIPGQIVAQDIFLTNAGSTAIAEVEMGLSSTATDDAGLPLDGSDLRDVLELRVFSSGTASGNSCSGTEVTSVIDTAVDPTPDGILTMSDFTGDTYDALAIALAPAGTDSVCIEVKMTSTAGNIYQGDSATATFSFTGNQDITQ